MEFVCQRCRKHLEVDDSVIHSLSSVHGTDKAKLEGLIEESLADPSFEPEIKRDVDQKPNLLLASPVPLPFTLPAGVAVPKDNPRGAKTTQKDSRSSNSSAKKRGAIRPSTSMPVVNEEFVMLSSDSSGKKKASKATSVKAIKPSTSNSNLAGKIASAQPTGKSDSGATSYSRLVLASRLFELATDATGIDHPLCAECTQVVFKELGEQLAEAEKEAASYKAFLSALDEETERYRSGELEALGAEIARLEQEERELQERLQQLGRERQAVQEELARQQQEALQLEQLEARYWAAYNEFSAALDAFEEERNAVRRRLESGTEQLEQLKKTNVYNDTFHIWHDGFFGTINGFRLGRLPSQPVDWNEINAAWGQATLLLYTMAKKLGFRFTQYRLVPLGSCSKVERLDDKTSYELYGSSDISLGRLFWYRRFDNAMVAFLKNLKELGDYAEQQDRNFRLPYRMEKDKISDMSIKIQFNNEETWTKALKYLLTNLKWLLAWMARRAVSAAAAPAVSAPLM